MAYIELDNTFSIKTSSRNFILIEKLNRFKRDKTPKIVENESYYGTMYQALQGYLLQSIDNAEDLNGIISKVKEVKETIDKLKQEIKKNFKITVEVAK